MWFMIIHKAWGRGTGRHINGLSQGLSSCMQQVSPVALAMATWEEPVSTMTLTWQRAAWGKGANVLQPSQPLWRREGMRRWELAVSRGAVRGSWGTGQLHCMFTCDRSFNVYHCLFLPQKCSTFIYNPKGNILCDTPLKNEMLLEHIWPGLAFGVKHFTHSKPMTGWKGHAWNTQKLTDYWWQKVTINVAGFSGLFLPWPDWRKTNFILRDSTTAVKTARCPYHFNFAVRVSVKCYVQNYDNKCYSFIYLYLSLWLVISLFWLLLSVSYKVCFSFFFW